MAVVTYTKSGNKATTAAKLDKSVFGLEVNSHELLKQAYLSYLANGRTNNAKVLKRGEVAGGGRKPWRQKGTGRARFGSIRNPIWRGGGITFGPTGEENYSIKLHTNAKRQALRQALSLSVASGKLAIIEAFDFKEGKVKPTLALLDKIGSKRNVLIVVDNKDELADRATRNLSIVSVVTAKYLNVYDVMNADTILMSQKSLEMVHEWLGSSPVKNSKEVTKKASK